MGCVHVIGAGLSGLSAAVSLACRGKRVLIHEASGHAGGRCRSYDDANLGCRIDNGNHLLLSGNTAALSFLETIGADGALTGPERAAFPFVDLDSGKRWTVAPGTGRIPWWIAVPSRSSSWNPSARVRLDPAAGPRHARSDSRGLYRRRRRVVPPFLGTLDPRRAQHVPS